MSQALTVAQQQAVAGVSSESLNSQCFCISMNEQVLRAELQADVGEPGLFELLQERCPHMFSAFPVFVSELHMARMAEVTREIEAVMALPAYRHALLANAPAIARHAPGESRGVFYGYDFHVAEDAFGLIEINTNAGGALLNALLAKAQRACCPEVSQLVSPSVNASQFETTIVDMFRQEWRLFGQPRPLRSIAIVDVAPEQQYLYPEFLLFKQLFEQHGLTVVIADPAQLTLRDGQLWHGEQVIDLVYNRLTDFYLESPECASLREAYLTDAALLTPHPQAHALYADKRNLMTLSDPQQLQALGVSESAQAILLGGIPRTQVVTPENAEGLWEARRQLFFKPFAGYGSRAAYRGDKLTKRVWQEIIDGGYVAQALVVPGQRVISAEQPAQILKFDLREYVYDGAVQWVAARLYQGQTTNFRTPGGGFAPVYPWPVAAAACEGGTLDSCEIAG